MNSVLKIGLAGMLLLCLLEMPYGYYELVRIASFVVLGYSALIEYRHKNYGLVPVYLIGMILFNPIEKVALGRNLWQIIDIIYATLLIITATVAMVNNKSKSVGNR